MIRRHFETWRNMPNWCECDLKVQGTKKNVEEFLRLVKSDESDFDFDRLIPYPENFKELDRIAAEWDKVHLLPRSEELWKTRPKDGYNQGGYEWCIKNWGTKWNAEDVQIEEIISWYWSALPDGTPLVSVEIHFSTAWSPPLPVIERASELFEELCFELRHFECGCAFNGLLRCEHGEITADKSGDYYGNRGG